MEMLLDFLSGKARWWDIIGVDEELWGIIEDGVTFEADAEGIVTYRKCMTPAQRKIYKKHHIVRGVLMNALPHAEYTKIVNRSTAKAIYESLCSTYEGNQQVKEAKANQLVH
jgi:hypothetical protein